MSTPHTADSQTRGSCCFRKGAYFPIFRFTKFNPGEHALPRAKKENQAKGSKGGTRKESCRSDKTYTD
jgi:hypothetical protein